VEAEAIGVEEEAEAVDEIAASTSLVFTVYTPFVLIRHENGVPLRTSCTVVGEATIVVSAVLTIVVSAVFVVNI